MTEPGNVNTGACDDSRAVTAIARGAGAWVHVGGERTDAVVDAVQRDGTCWMGAVLDVASRS